MRKEIYINPKYASLNDFINRIPEKFEQLGVLIHTGRNDVRDVECRWCTRCYKIVYKNNRVEQISVCNHKEIESTKVLRTFNEFARRWYNIAGTYCIYKLLQELFTGKQLLCVCIYQLPAR